MSRLARPVAALFALWFAIVLGDPGMLHACPMHGTHSGAAAATQQDASAHAHGAAHVSPTAGEQEQTDSQAPCTCIGHCCAATATAPVTATEVLVASVQVVLPTTRPTVPSRDVPASPDVRLPFANGPPRA